MVRAAPIIQKSVFLSVNNPRTPMAETQSRVLAVRAGANADSISGMVLAGSERWLCCLEGEAAQVQSIIAMLEQQERPRQWHLLMTNSHVKTRMFPQHRLGWRNGCTPLEMAAFLSDLNRSASRTQIWHIPLHDIFALLEPAQ